MYLYFSHKHAKYQQRQYERAIERYTKAAEYLLKAADYESRKAETAELVSQVRKFLLLVVKLNMSEGSHTNAFKDIHT